MPFKNHNQASQESHLAHDKLGLFLRVLKHVYDDNFLEVYRGLVPALQVLDNTSSGRSFVIALNHYLVTSANMENLAKFRDIALESYSEETGGATMTLADVLEKQGEKKTQEKVVQNMLQRGFDAQTIAEVTELTLEEIALMTKKAS